jgi:hypothetical protein
MGWLPSQCDAAGNARGLADEKQGGDDVTIRLRSVCDQAWSAAIAELRDQLCLPDRRQSPRRVEVLGRAAPPSRGRDPLLPGRHLGGRSPAIGEVSQE